MAKKQEQTYGVTADQLRSYIERIERLEEEKSNISKDIREVFAEAKGNGFDAKAMREVLKIRKRDAMEQDELDYILETYKRALGMLREEYMGTAGSDGII